MYNVIGVAMVAELADAQDSDSCELKLHVGSTPIRRTIFYSEIIKLQNVPMRVRFIQFISMIIFAHSMRLSGNSSDSVVFLSTNTALLRASVHFTACPYEVTSFP